MELILERFGRELRKPRALAPGERDRGGVLPALEVLTVSVNETV